MRELGTRTGQRVWAGGAKSWRCGGAGVGAGCAVLARVTDANLREKPAGVPDEAVFHEEWGEWIAGQEREGKCVGTWRQWHATQGHLTCVDEYDAQGRLQFVTRFHPDGTYSQKVPHKDGVPHGVGQYQGSHLPTDERVLETMPECVFAYELYWEDGKQPRPARFFDIKGREINLEGQPKPRGLPEQARADGDGAWVLTAAVLQDEYEGIERKWRADGSPRFERHCDADGKVLRMVEYHPDGEVARELDYVEGTGVCRRCLVDSDVDLPDMPGDAVLMRFRIDVVDPKSGLYWAREQAYFDANGAALSDGGRTIRKPHEDAFLVTDGSWYQPKTYWCHDETREDSTRVRSWWTQDATLVMRATYRNDTIVAFSQYAEDGACLVEETFHVGKQDDRGRPVNRTITVHGNDTRTVITCRDDGSCASLSFVGNDGASRTVTAEGDEVGTVDGFEREFRRRFESLLPLRHVVVWSDFFEISGLEMESCGQYFAATALTGDGAGNSAVVVSEGKYAGHVYFLDHEEGLYCLEDECIEEYLDEEGHDPATMTKDEIVEAMSFFGNEVTDSLAAFLAGIKVSSHTSYYRGLKDFAPVTTA